jgi:hypothetical protein
MSSLIYGARAPLRDQKRNLELERKCRENFRVDVTSVVLKELNKTYTHNSFE